MPSRGPDTITVPGAVAGWEALHRLGARLPWARAFERAIELADGGTPLPLRTPRDWPTPRTPRGSDPTPGWQRSSIRAANRSRKEPRSSNPPSPEPWRRWRPAARRPSTEARSARPTSRASAPPDPPEHRRPGGARGAGPAPAPGRVPRPARLGRTAELPRLLGAADPGGSRTDGARSLTARSGRGDDRAGVRDRHARRPAAPGRPRPHDRASVDLARGRPPGRIHRRGAGAPLGTPPRRPRPTATPSRSSRPTPRVTRSRSSRASGSGSGAASWIRRRGSWPTRVARASRSTLRGQGCSHRALGPPTPSSRS